METFSLTEDALSVAVNANCPCLDQPFTSQTAGEAVAHVSWPIKLFFIKCFKYQESLALA